MCPAKTSIYLILRTANRRGDPIRIRILCTNCIFKLSKQLDQPLTVNTTLESIANPLGGDLWDVLENDV